MCSGATARKVFEAIRPIDQTRCNLELGSLKRRSPREKMKTALPSHVFSHVLRARGLRSGLMQYGAPYHVLRGRRMSPGDLLYRDVLFESSYPCEHPVNIFKNMFKYFNNLKFRY